MERGVIVLAEKVQANYQLPIDLKEAVANKAKAVGRTASDLVEEILKDGLPRVVTVTADRTGSE